MARITRWEWHGSFLVLTVLCLTVVLLPGGVVYFITNLLKIEEEVKDADKLSQFLANPKK